jgi:hypothetical protein
MPTFSNCDETVLEAFELAQHYELSIENQARKRQKVQFKSNTFNHSQTRKTTVNKEKGPEVKPFSSISVKSN